MTPGVLASGVMFSLTSMCLLLRGLQVVLRRADAMPEEELSFSYDSIDPLKLL
ncbi:hypothetical protein PT974_06684 [Cladobotryum mycophilum]|uniref:Uncharacterized protein n=1 Tax=Cladobotryum mycophilum TaxID=491253 RepID=A0ABR0SNB5_9HYPO